MRTEEAYDIIYGIVQNMSTEELKRLLSEDLAEIYSENDEIIYGFFWTVWKDRQKLVVNGYVSLPILNVLGKYTNTNVEDR